MILKTDSFLPANVTDIQSNINNLKNFFVFFGIVSRSCELANFAIFSIIYSCFLNFYSQITQVEIRKSQYKNITLYYYNFILFPRYFFYIFLIMKNIEF